MTSLHEKVSNGFGSAIEKAGIFAIVWPDSACIQAQLGHLKGRLPQFLFVSPEFASQGQAGFSNLSSTNIP